MMKVMFIRNLVAVCLIMQALFNYCLAQGGLGEILPDDIAENAEVSVLEAEANVFNTIKKGIALSLAMCEGVEQCAPTVNRVELEQIITTLDARIGNLGQRYEQSGDTALEGLLVAYADARDGYTQYLEKLATIVVEEPEEPANLFGSDFFGGAGTAQDPDREFAIFNDVDQELQDDEELGEEETTTEPEAGAVEEPAADTIEEEQTQVE
ncbi:MAG: hypothetical protein HW386_1997 [Gammaproteobacteria bacterium]|nr:hypothetical protein [Gammaproteobacteria bacterium]